MTANAFIVGAKAFLKAYQAMQRAVDRMDEEGSADRAAKRIIDTILSASGDLDLDHIEAQIAALESKTRTDRTALAISMFNKCKKHHKKTAKKAKKKAKKPAKRGKKPAKKVARKPAKKVARKPRKR